uniref:glutathione transferase n=1 Tax=Riptortus pedestris TaxID=329032 RepID=R4WIB6_RIPPE|nr:glutathionetransferase [Riptortus pedestris]
MPEYKLTYFNVKGLGEGIRYLLAYSGKEFKDNRIDQSQWASLKGETPFGKVPVLEIDGKKYHQSTAILRYLAVEAGVSGSTPLENLHIDQIVGAAQDLITEVAGLWKQDESKKEDYKKKLINETVPYYFGKFEHVLKENKGFLANGKLSWADIFLVSYSETMATFLGIKDLHDKYPNFAALVHKIQSLPGIKEWIEKRPSSF